MYLINKKPTFDGGPAESNPNLDPETAHRLDPLAETFAFIPLSGKIPLIKGWPANGGYSIEELLNYQNCTTIGARTGFLTGPLLCFDLDGETLMLAPATGFYATPNTGLNQVRIAYVLNKKSLDSAIRILAEALKVYPGRI